MANSAFNHEPSFTIPGSTTDNAVIRWDGTSGTGQLSSGIIIDDSNVITGVTSLTVDNLLIDGNTISSTAGTDLFITPLGGQQLILDGTIIIDAGVVTAATSITSTEFVGGGVGLTALNGTQITSGTVPVARLSAASTTAAGIAELATTAETNTGTATARTVTPDGLAGSVHGEKVIQMVVVDFATALTTGNGKFYFHVPSTLNGFDIVDVHAEVISAPAGSTIIIQLHNLTATADILTTLLTIDASETGSDTAAAAAVISGSEDDLTTNDVIRVDIDQIGSSTAGSGLIVTLICRLP